MTAAECAGHDHSMSDVLRVAVLGPGGVGGMLGVLLSRQGHAVTCLARPGTAEHIDRKSVV